MRCPICDASELDQHGHYGQCHACGYWQSDLDHDVTNTSAPDEEYELVSYEHTRRANYSRILQLLAKRHPAGSTMLEVGCADGLFLDMATRDNGYDVIGIEPNTRMMAGNKLGHQIRQGFFPDVLAPDEKFDIIALNCVFEHVPDLAAMIGAFKRHLEPSGSVMLNVPVASGFMFKAARQLYRLGVKYPFDRLWQKGFVSPHLHYFARKSLQQLLGKHGFSLTFETPLAMFSLGGIYARLSLDPNIRFAQRIAALGSLYAYYPVSRVAPDARAFVFVRGAG
ncbi:MAG TPA: class I SAM-dependent methyltransferase [Kofleriaceae bacterium]|nr:class I SAM-dependent methyltransferase [Kofleriaceae bacterium]